MCVYERQRQRVRKREIREGQRERGRYIENEREISRQERNIC